ncbi:MAG TPA: hypothetical protein VLW85_26615 [Myxococcales bacterium]|nr:hypothetical protein [Myxococcales bacterium]
MLIRCERCAAVFSLQDAVGAGAPFQVECGRCLLVFEAKPLPKPVTPPPQARVQPLPAAPGPGALERKAQADELAKALRPRRPEDELQSELLKVTARRRRRIRWAAGVALVAALTLLGLGLRQRFLKLPPQAQARIDKARELLLKDDPGSLQEATALFSEAARLAPGEAMPEGERGFALLLQAAAQSDLAMRLLAAQKQQEGDELQRAATRLLQHGIAAAKAALEDDPDDEAALRAMALGAALTNAADPGPLDRLSPQDPWALYVKAVSQRKSPDAALATLAQARQAEPRMLRAQVEIAALAMDRQEPGPAREALGQVLQANAQHDRARRMLALLPAAPQ